MLNTQPCVPVMEREAEVARVCSLVGYAGVGAGTGAGKGAGMGVGMGAELVLASVANLISVWHLPPPQINWWHTLGLKQHILYRSKIGCSVGEVCVETSVGCVVCLLLCLLDDPVLCTFNGSNSSGMANGICLVMFTRIGEIRDCIKNWFKEALSNHHLPHQLVC